MANDFALGYTYQDVLDADHEGKILLFFLSGEASLTGFLDTLARLSIYFLSEPSPAFASLLRPLFTPQLIPESLLVILLDWNEPWSWVRQLRDWILLLRNITASLSDEAKEVLEQTMKEWQEKKRGTSSYDTSSTSTSNDTSVTLPLSQGEWDEPLGLPLCVVCHNVCESLTIESFTADTLIQAEKINTIEIEQNWGEENFDFVLQYIRTILMKRKC